MSERFNAIERLLKRITMLPDSASMPKLLHQIRSFEQRVIRLRLGVSLVSRRLRAEAPRPRSRPRRLLTIEQMQALELRGVRQVEIAERAGISVRQVRFVLSAVRTRPNGRPLGS